LPFIDARLATSKHAKGFLIFGFSSDSI